MILRGPQTQGYILKGPMHWKQHVFFVNKFLRKTNTIFCASFWFLFRETPLNSNSSNITLVSSHGSVDSLNFAQRSANSSKSVRFNVAHGHVQQCCTQGNKKRKRRACRAARSNWGSWKETWDITACNCKVCIFGWLKKAHETSTTDNFCTDFQWSSMWMLHSQLL